MPRGALCGEVREGKIPYRSGQIRRWTLDHLIEIRRRVEVGIEAGTSMKGPEDVHRFLAPIYTGLDQEMFICIALNGRHHVASPYVVSVGTLNASLVHPREVFRPAILLGAASLVMAHNHPSGDSTPSNEDREITKRMVGAGEIIGINVLDHVVWTQASFMSLKELGWMDVQ